LLELGRQFLVNSSDETDPTDPAIPSRALNTRGLHDDAIAKARDRLRCRLRERQSSDTAAPAVQGWCGTSTPTCALRYDHQLPVRALASVVL